jgi:hypothetical protein
MAENVQGCPLPRSCSALGLHPSDWTEERSYQAANKWWESKLLEVLPAVKDTKLLAIELLVGEKIETQEQADIAVRFLQEKIAFDPSFTLPEGFHQLWLGNNRYSQLENGVKEVVEAAAPDPARTVSASIDQYLAIQAGRQKPKTFKELKDFMDTVRGWYGSLGVSSLDENRVAEVHGILAAASFVPNTKKKRWNLFRQFVRYCAEAGRI